MSHRKFALSFPWARYSKKLCNKIETPRHGGFFSVEEAKERGMHLAVGGQGEPKDGNAVSLYLLVDASDGVIADAKFQAFGQSALIGAAEAACELLMRKNYDQARKLTAELIDRQVRDKTDIPAFPEETFAHLNLVIDAIEMAAEQCLAIPLAPSYVPTPLDAKKEGEGYPGWSTLSREQKISVIEEVIATEIRPYIELDAGGVQIMDLVNDRELIIAYEGACTTCHSATGATLNAIQEILKARVDANLVVVPDASFLSPGI
ncbi:MAG: iron-sulfur cluster assembly scaffold protein [Candidatus Melainabacteria bacterium]|nr:iron-sulfur cluster assembly scaffold protein [Candidatus Melainabacteria bacterium]